MIALKNRTDIIIKPANKGSSVVVMDRDQYISEAERQLNDNTYYQLLDHDPTTEFAIQVADTVNKMHDEGYITEKNMEYLLVEKPRAGRFYLLPKIHKSGNPGRPIVSANGHPTERISEFVDFHLKPHVRNLPSFLQDTTDYLSKIESNNVLPPNTLLVSMDVTSLYTNIPHDDGISACRHVWDNRLIKEPPTSYLVKLLSLILKCNNFEFNGKHYLQVQGTAMGTKMAPSYANIFMGRLENLLLQSVSLKPHTWLRFIDDIDMQWCHGRDSLQDFLHKANAFHPTIKFTSEISNNEHIFLDTKSHIQNDKIVVDLHTKPTDSHQYLLPNSCHPKHCSKNIPYSLALRIKRICSDPNTFEIRATELSQHLINRGYNPTDILNAIQKARERNRNDLLKYKHKPDTSLKRTPFVLTYHPNTPNIKMILNTHWPTIQSSAQLKDIFPEKPIIAYRRPKSLRDILVRAKLKPNLNDTPLGQSGPCGTHRCQTCNLMSVTQSFTQTTTGAIINIKVNANCKTRNIVYLMTCKQCQKQYVGETKLQLNQRINLHRSDVNTHKLERSPIAEHIHTTGHTFSDISLCCIDHNPNWSDRTRKLREIYWIRRLNTTQPHGINKSDEFRISRQNHA